MTMRITITNGDVRRDANGLVIDMLAIYQNGVKVAELGPDQSHSMHIWDGAEVTLKEIPCIED